ncbi:sugar ABC transporter substrate-binding protein [Microvirga sp. KLBC 81]|uniref:ABC transporter substrate-binding protein n=1 Tax=Microvirga sp. KLBC 81 TaxID=1862707 RepID=UPI000D512B2E|nr:ABC transporter substrate-binding protein [Microvirga sp. KLBC 81]PVE22694.1 sugar ABC transporter substrate-binding protein [Microvirga sp. KLBC 81]
MNRRSVMFALAHAGLLALARPVSAQKPPRIVFLNPGEPVDRGAGPYWQMVSDSMRMAAQMFGMQLEVLFAERDHLRMLRQAEEVAQRADAPDYIVIVNEKLAAQQILNMLAQSPAKILLIHNDLTPQQRREVGNERQHIRNWIGTVTADATRAGYLLMEYLYHRLGDREPRVVGITGDPNTPVSLERAEGVRDYIVQAGRGTIHQLVYGDWSYADGENKATILLARYPDTNIIWAANDSMALGALRAVKARGASVLVGGMGGWPDALSSVAEGGLTATAAGNFLIGAWAIILLNDYHNGHDFAAHGGVSQSFDYLVVGHENVARYDDIVMKRKDMLDFRSYSKALHPRPGPYDFSLKGLVEKRNLP